MALPPWHVLLLLIPAFSGLYYLATNASASKRAFLDGWWFGVGFFGLSLSWIIEAFRVNPEDHGWAGPFAVILITAGMALFPAFALASYKWFSHRIKFFSEGKILIFAANWAIFEWFRSWFLSGFPWNLLATVWIPFEPILQIISVIGTLGLSALTVFLASSPALIFNKNYFFGACVVSFSFLIVVNMWVFGSWRIQVLQLGFVEDVRIRLVQPNIPQNIKWENTLRLQHLLKLSRLSQQVSSSEVEPTLVIWPETAVPYVLPSSKKIMNILAASVPQGGLIITGAARRQELTKKMWNSIFAINSAGQMIAVYDKHHLVPFGEYVPFRSWLPFKKLVQERGDFSTGVGPRTILIPGLPPVMPLICFEAIFSGIVKDTITRPEWFLNVTNDAWFGNTAGPWQHLAAARLRTIEEGIPMVRVANTGISSVINSLGQIVASAPLDTEMVIDARLPKSLEFKTIFAQTNALSPFAFITCLFAISALITRLKKVILTK